MDTAEGTLLPAPLRALALGSVLSVALLQACDNATSPTGNDLPGPTPLPVVEEDGRIGPHPENPSYWQYRGAPVLLLGGSDQDNLFNHPDLPPSGLEAHLDLLESVGGNYVRNTMSSRDEGNVQAFRRLPDGRYDLTSEDPEYWSRFERLLEMTDARGIIVQVEIWDRFDFAGESWDENPFHPSNNVNYTEHESGLPLEIRTHPGARENPFFRSTPAQEDNPLVLEYQRAYVARLLEIALPFPNVLYTINNETNESPLWSDYWADFIKERADELGVVAHVTEMWDAWELEDPVHGYVVDDPNRYRYLELSQNNHQMGQAHWNQAQAFRARVASHPRPLNSVKIYGGPRHGGSFEEGTRKFWRNILGGLASSRFHRPSDLSNPSGIGLNELAQAHIRSMRMLTDEISIFSGEPRPDLLSDRADDEAYAMAEAGRWVAVYFPAEGSVALDLGEVPGPLLMRSLDILAGEWSPATLVAGGGVRLIQSPGGGPRAVLFTAQDGP